jgi:hypothetical protein
MIAATTSASTSSAALAAGECRAIIAAKAAPTGNVLA